MFPLKFESLNQPEKDCDERILDELLDFLLKENKNRAPPGVVNKGSFFSLFFIPRTIFVVDIVPKQEKTIFALIRT